MFLARMAYSQTFIYMHTIYALFKVVGITLSLSGEKRNGAGSY